MVERKRNEQGPLNAEQRKRLREYVSEIERYEDEIDRIKLDVKGAYDALKADGIDVAALKKVIADRKREPEQLDLEQTVVWYRAVVAQSDKPPKSLVIDRPFAPPLDA